jgi:hypothetical protein
MLKFIEDQRSIGFDPQASPPWLMVGENDVEYVVLSGGDDDQLSFQSGKSSVVSIASDELLRSIPSFRRVIGIRGHRPGTDMLLAKDPHSGQVGKLEIDVLLTRRLTVRFYLLSDRAGHHTVRTCAEARSMLSRAHDIHFRQNRVCLVPEGCQSVRLPFDAGPVPKTSWLLGVLNNLFHGQLRRCRADFHVFLVWDFEDDLNLEPGPDGSAAVTVNRVLGVTNGAMQLCAIKDFSERIAGEVLAHEVGHYLRPDLSGANAHHPDPKNLMYWQYWAGAGIKLDRDQCRRMNGNTGFLKMIHQTCAPSSPARQQPKARSRS